MQEKIRLEEFLERIQSADESTKKRWLVVSVGIASVFIVFLWVANFSFMMSGYTPQVVASNTPDSPSFFATIGQGVGAVEEGLSRGVHVLGSALATPREDIVKPP